MIPYAPGSASGDSRDNLDYLQTHSLSLKKEYREKMVFKNTIQAPVAATWPSFLNSNPAPQSASAELGEHTPL